MTEDIAARAGHYRLLPWTGEEGKPCYVLTDGTGPVSRVADAFESVQLGMAEHLLDHADDLLDEDSGIGPVELHFLASRLTESLRLVKRIAESRSRRAMRPAGGTADL
ncbi:hypothetical protein [uncultured Streptomyces sp.]|uniref:hypothetical protein n=1 Tax=uncultured Streptomyces sp. TaxID=174707 RepID=UPI0026039E0A|nr:hypothetical protein [uncultured Streptomyces sp.]